MRITSENGIFNGTLIVLSKSNFEKTLSALGEVWLGAETNGMEHPDDTEGVWTTDSKMFERVLSAAEMVQRGERILSLYA